MGGNIAKNKKEEIPKYREKTPYHSLHREHAH